MVISYLLKAWEMGKALDMMPDDRSKKPREIKETIIGDYQNAIRLAKNTGIESLAHFYMGHLYMTVGWEGRDEKALACYEKYLEQQPDGEFAKEAQFRQMETYIGIGKADKAKALFEKYKFQEKYPESGFTTVLLRLFKENKQ